MHLQDFYTAFDIGIIDGNLPVETAGTQQRGIQNIRAVGGGNNDDAVIYSKAVHFYKKLVQRLLTLIVTAAPAGAAVTADRVNLVDEHDTGRSLFRGLKQISYA